MGYLFTTIFVTLLYALLHSSAASSNCEEKLQHIPEESPAYHVLKLICKALENIKISASSQNDTEKDERTFLAVVFRNYNYVLNETEAGSGNFNSTRLDELPGGIVVDYDPVEGYMYCSKEGIYKAKLDGSNFQQVMNSDKTIEGIAIDWVARNMYWTDEDNTIQVCRLDGSHQKTLLNGSVLDNPRAIAVDPSRGKIYWTEWGDNPRIASAWMDGSNVKTIIDTDIVWPNGMALDIERNRLYWGDASKDKMSAVNTDGTDAVDLDKVGEVPHIFGMGYTDDYIYWTDWRTDNIERYHVNGTSKREVIEASSTGAQPFGLKATKLYPPPGVTNLCSRNNGGCSHLCFFTPAGRQCGCEEDWELTEDGSCMEN